MQTDQCFKRVRNGDGYMLSLIYHIVKMLFLFLHRHHDSLNDTTIPIILQNKALYRNKTRYSIRGCAGAGVQELTPAGVGVFQQEPQQDQE